MAWWGKALAFGPNINDFGYERPSEAFPSAVKALELKESATLVEKALIEAMAVRYTNDTSKSQNRLNILYRDAMHNVYESNKQNENVSALYADALMLLHPWDLYNHDFTPKAWTPEIVAVLQHTLQINPKHPGANRYFIHAVEGSSMPQDALPSAEFLADAMPEVSHITHMPSHIFIRTGYYDKGIQVNEKALNGYKKYLGYFPVVEENIALYELHNIHMKANCAQMAGNYCQSLSAAEELQEKIPAFYLQIPGALGNYVQYLHQAPLFTYVRFGMWQDILSMPVNDSLSFTPVLQQFARGLAFARTNRLQLAKTELNKMRNSMSNPILKVPLTPFNAVYDAAVVAENILAGVIAEEKKDFKIALNHFEIAVKQEDKLIYNEPRDWLLPARHYLGNALVKAGKYKEAVAVFDEDLSINPNNGWALSGLAKSYKSINNKTALATAQSRLRSAWILKDVPIESAVF